MNLRSQKGINIITLSVAIIILVLITSVLVYSSKDGVKIRNLKDLYNDVELLDNKIAAYYTEHGDIPKLDKYTNTSFLNNANYEEINPNNGNDYYVVNLDAMDGITLNYGKDYKEIKDETGTVNVNVNDYDDLYIVNEASHTVYYPKGINMQGVNYYTYGEEWKKVDLTVIPIETAEQFAKIGSGESLTINGINYTFSLDGIYVLKNDIDLSSICYKVDGTTLNDKSWTPIGVTRENAFTGKFYGNGHTIRGLYINTTAGNQGLFGFNKGTIQDITVEGKITATSLIIGGIVGTNDNLIYNCNSYVSIIASKAIGGITGVNNKNVRNCKNYAKLEGTIENINSGCVGGIVGENYQLGTIENSYNEGKIIAKSNCIGGISGASIGIINLCCNNGDVTSSRSGVGGITGDIYADDSKIINCYNIKEIRNVTATGGIVGECKKGQVLNCYSIGTVGGTYVFKSVIGLKTATNAIIRNNFYLSTLTTTDENATPKNREEMKSQSFVDLLNTGQIDEPWVMDTMGINDGYPVLKWQMEE